MKRLLVLATLAATLCSAPQIAEALPQFASTAGRACDNCHIAPEGWDNPELSQRKCSLNCSTCHVNPTGGGMRTASGTYYGREMLPLFAIGKRPSENVYLGPDERPASHPADGAGGPQPNTEARYGGITPNHWWQLGFDARFMGYFPHDPAEKNAFFPMQLDLHTALRPYNPDEYNSGRLTVLATLGFEGNRNKEFSDTLDRFFIKEYMAIFSDLPYQIYGKIGRFLPAFGWRLDDHTPFIRQGQSFDNERQVTGVEVGFNPNYFYLNASFFNPAPNWDEPFDGSAGIGTATTLGWRDLFWQAGGSFMLENNDDRTDTWAGANWSLNFHESKHPWKWGSDYLPVTYLGEFDVRVTAVNNGETTTGLTAFHEFNVWPTRGLNFKFRYDWQDPNVSLLDDHRHRYTVGFELHPVTGVELITQFRHNAEAGITRDNDEVLVQIHGWF